MARTSTYNEKIGKKICSLLKKKTPRATIAEELGVATSTVSAWIKKHGLK
jgi:Mn-dependent DtxR family transcriptional regulator